MDSLLDRGPARSVIVADGVCVQLPPSSTPNGCTPCSFHIDVADGLLDKNLASRRLPWIQNSACLPFSALPMSGGRRSGDEPDGASARVVDTSRPSPSLG
ncbi:Uncharacterized protein PBTT_06374 [Plasmodiophora brassicae]